MAHSLDSTKRCTQINTDGRTRSSKKLIIQH
jgi:hypothetical protein